MITLSEAVLSDIRRHAAECSPRESCGLLVMVGRKMIYWPCLNVGMKNDHFILSPDDYAKAEDVGIILAIVHSHPFQSAEPSEADRVACENSGLPWVIVNHPNGDVAQIEPSGFKAPLIGRTFSHGVLDCYTLIRDYYAQELGILLPDYDRPDEWWHNGGDLYRQYLDDAGFVLVDTPQAHDMLVMRVHSPVPNHGAVLEPNGTILHHPMGQLSRRDVFGGYYRKVTVMVCRHKTMIERGAQC